MSNSPNYSAEQFLRSADFNTAAATVLGASHDTNKMFHSVGIINPASATYTFSGLNVTSNLPSPFAIEFTSGALTFAHGTATNADTSTYTTSFASLVPATGSVVVYLCAQAVTIQQVPQTIVGPPPGHPSYNPNFEPVTGYLTNVESLQLVTTTLTPTNVTTFELGRLTLTAGQTTITALDVSHVKLASSLLAPTGVVPGTYTNVTATVTADGRVTAMTSGFTPVQQGGGIGQLTNKLFLGWTAASKLALTVDASNIGNVAMESWVTGNFLGLGGNETVTGAVAFSSNVSVGGNFGVVGISSLTGAVAVGSTLTVTGASTLNGTVTITDPTNTVSSPLQIQSEGTSGVAIKLTGNGATTPSKYLRVLGGAFQIVNSASSAVIWSLTDAGSVSVVGNQGINGTLNVGGVATLSGSLITTDIEVTAAQTIGTTLTVAGAAAFNGGATAAALSVTGNAQVNGTINSNTGISTLGVVSAGGNITSSGQFSSLLGLNTSGNVTVGVTINPDPVGAGLPGVVIAPQGNIDSYSNACEWGTGTNILHNFFAGHAVFIGSISTNGSSTFYNATSDHRTKIGVVNLTGALDRINMVPVRRFAFVENATDDPDAELPLIDGWFAHEMAIGVPEAVGGEKDETRTYTNVVVSVYGKVIKEGVTEAEWEAGKLAAPPLYMSSSVWAATLTQPVYQTIDRSMTAPVMWAALQEAYALIKGLRDDVDTLKAA